MSIRSVVKNINQYRAAHISDRNFLLVASIIVGVAVGLVAVALKKSVHALQYILREGFKGHNWQYLYYLLPLIGILITVFFVQKIRKGKIGNGISNIIQSISKRHGNISPDNMYSHMVSSAVTVGFGGSVGLEAPIVITGSAFGSNIARVFLLSHKERVVLLACGAAAGIAAVFNTPVAGVLFAMEVLLAEFSIPTFIPVLIASASGAVVSRLLYNEHLFYLLTKDWRTDAIPFYLLLGGLCGLVSVYFMRVYFWTEKKIASAKKVLPKAIGGGLLLGFLIFLFPVLYGEGYSTIAALFKSDTSKLLSNTFYKEWVTNPYVLLLIAIGVVLFKVIASAVTIHAGGNGGIFAPTLFTGAVTGFTFAHFFNTTGWKELLTVNFVAAGMAGILSGVVHAPLTAIFLIAEVTGGYTLFVPLMIVAAVSYFITRAFEPYSIYTEKLAQKGFKIDDKELVLLNNIKPEAVVDRNFIALRPNDAFRKLSDAFLITDQTVFPVLNEERKLIGLVYLDDVKSILLKEEVFDRKLISEVMVKPQYTVSVKDDIQKIMRLFDISGLWCLSVINTDGSFIGFADKRKLLALLRETLTSHQLMEQL
ncbi:chloride channel protein [Lacibacter sediminis]|uniref:Chloride channel protein n=1 Tax=Lacibacter sediminis TaxID=2760713 RepID=A0A7G5XKZ6_9BACT|nr:chloride channel protein [Lacibacter sediminis]QNA46149.1 chloride channel protein [Lacibacter sediminis]